MFVLLKASSLGILLIATKILLVQKTRESQDRALAQVNLNCHNLLRESEHIVTPEKEAGGYLKSQNLKGDYLVFQILSWL